MSEETLFVKVGGQAKVDKAVDSVLDRFCADPRLRNRFQGRDMPRIREHMKTYVSRLLKNEAQPEESRLDVSHQGLGITPEEFDLAVSFFEKTTYESGCSYDDSQQVAALINSLREQVIRK